MNSEVGGLIAVLIAITLAFANGANDNSKGVATLIGSGRMAFRPALLLAAVATLLGSLAAVYLAVELTDRFSGKGIVDAGLAATPDFALAVGLGAAVTVLAATRMGLPISTTHALVGAITGTGIAAGGYDAAAAGRVFMFPLLVSPLLALALAGAANRLAGWVATRSGISAQTCLCIGDQVQPVRINHDGMLLFAATGTVLTAAEREQCEQRYVGNFLGVEVQSLVNWVHMFSATGLSFARGLNDTPKIAAIIVAGGGLAGAATGSSGGALALTGLAIAAGGLLAVRRVGETMSYRITGMGEGDSCTANLTAAFLVIGASRFGVPVSTTHVTCGSLFGIGAVSGGARWGMIRRVLLAWLATLPAAAALGWLAWQVIR